MTGIRNGVVAIIKEQATHCTSSHCDLHREKLASKSLNSGDKGPFDIVMDDVVKSINEIKASSKKSRMFTLLCEEMSEVNRTILFHCEIRWLSRGAALIRLFSLRKAVLAFFNEQKSRKAVHFTDDLWLSKLGYLSNFFSKLNVLNRSLQGKGMDIFTAHDIIEAFKLKLPIWKQRIQARDVTDFPNLQLALTEATDSDDKDDQLVENVLSLAMEHLALLMFNFSKYFPPISQEEHQKPRWIINQFCKDIFSGSNLNNSQLKMLVDLSCDARMKDLYKESSRTQFWAKAHKEEYYKN